MTKLTMNQLAQVYRGHIARDFVRNERRPLYAIRSMHAKGLYTAWADVRCGALLAYACFIESPAAQGVLLDYFAVVPALRGKGEGSVFLKQLVQGCTAEGIIIESERPAAAQDAAEQEVRRRRIAFYLRGGAQLTDVAVRLFGVDYNLLWLPARPGAAVDVAGSMRALYAQTMPAFMLNKVMQLYSCADGAPCKV